MIFDVWLRNDIRRDLVESAWDYQGSDWTGEILRPWIAGHPEVLRGLERAGEPGMGGVAFDDADLWFLYGMSRVVETLTLSQQPAGDVSRFGDAPPVEPGAYQALAELLGGWWPATPTFHPFLHEIVQLVEAENPDEEPSLVRQWWPGCLVGSLLLSRAGVTVRAGRHYLRPRVAETSTLFWAWKRRYRPASDRSHGWGSNSQWRTTFRRDYLVDGMLHYNVDAEWQRPPDLPVNDISDDALIDLVRHRCSVIQEPAVEVIPWFEHFHEPAPEWLST